MKIFSGNSNPDLANSICSYLGVPLGNSKIKRFSDGEVWVEVGENVRGQDVFIVQSTCYPANDHLMELLILIDAVKRASAKRITAVIPYFGYARQDRKVAPRTPITAKLVADLIVAAGANRVLTMDLHAGQIQGFFNIPVDHLYGTPVLLQYIRDLQKSPLVVVSPDAGGVERARAFAKYLDASLAIIDKRREKANVSEVMNVIGNVEGKYAVLVDDLVDTAGTMTNAISALLAAGAKEVFCAASHAVLSGPAIDRLEKSDIVSIGVTDTIPLRENAKQCKKVKVYTVANILGEAIKRIHNEDSVSSLFI